MPILPRMTALNKYIINKMNGDIRRRNEGQFVAERQLAELFILILNKIINIFKWV
ncbi:hypothetical protein Mgra_00005528 [Meloidogyne graminicola]|uniref:Uncharacterized protein n=1 Tax=Meloidogyne graminicola TaxID=189291 RepID=A0A8S9ZPU0_9BILA|nr:hypothetical protein Mgra_00005528 [Meloidogyne graminicola]